MSRIDSFDPPEANPPVRRGPRRPDGPLDFVRDSLAMAWRWLTRMRTALYLLGVLGLLSLIATVVPQQPNVPSTVADWRAGVAGPGAAVSALIDVVGGYDMYGSPVFLALLLLLFLSLTACLIPRIRAWVRLARRGRPPVSRNLASHPEVATFDTSAPPADVLAASRTLLSRRRWRVRAPEDDVPDQVAAEKGIVSREGGSLLFHVSFYVLLVAVILGQLLGFKGQVGVIEGRSFTDTEVAYWRTTPGRWFGPEDHTGFTLTLDKFDVQWVRSLRFMGQPTVFRSEVTITQPDGTSFHDTVGGNDPLIVDGMKIHQLGWGYAPHLVVKTADGTVVHDGLLTANSTSRGFFRTAVKAPAADPDIGLAVAVYPNAPPGDDGTPIFTGAPWDDNPVVVLAEYRGDLKLDRVQNVDELDLDGLELVDTRFVPLGGEVTFSDGVTVSFPELRRWVGFQVSKQPTVPYLLLGALLLLLGLIPALYAYRRRVWIRATARPDGDGTIVTVAGRAFQRPQAFSEEHADLVRELRAALPESQDRPHPDPVPALADVPNDGSIHE